MCPLLRLWGEVVLPGVVVVVLLRVVVLLVVEGEGLVAVAKKQIRHLQ